MAILVLLALALLATLVIELQAAQELALSDAVGERRPRRRGVVVVRRWVVEVAVVGREGGVGRGDEGRAEWAGRRGRGGRGVGQLRVDGLRRGRVMDGHGVDAVAAAAAAA